MEKPFQYVRFALCRALTGEIPENLEMFML